MKLRQTPVTSDSDVHTSLASATATLIHGGVTLFNCHILLPFPPTVTITSTVSFHPHQFHPPTVPIYRILTCWPVSHPLHRALPPVSFAVPSDLSIPVHRMDSWEEEEEPSRGTDSSTMMTTKRRTASRVRGCWKRTLSKIQ